MKHTETIAPPPGFEPELKKGNHFHKNISRQNQDEIHFIRRGLDLPQVAAQLSAAQ